MAAGGKRARRAPRYRVVAYELEGEHATVVMDASGDGFVAAVGTILAEGRMQGEFGGAGPADVQAHIALLIANESEGDRARSAGRLLTR